MKNNRQFSNEQRDKLVAYCATLFLFSLKINNKNYGNNKQWKIKLRNSK